MKNSNRAVVETPAESILKYEMDKKTGKFFIDRHLTIPPPLDYGFISNTPAPDGDDLDCFIISAERLNRGDELNYSTLGYFECDDNGESDDKLIICMKGYEPRYHIYAYKETILEYLTKYKRGFKVGKWVDGPHPLENIEEVEPSHKWHPISRF